MRIWIGICTFILLLNTGLILAYGGDGQAGIKLLAFTTGVLGLHSLLALLLLGKYPQRCYRNLSVNQLFIGLGCSVPLLILAIVQAISPKALTLTADAAPDAELTAAEQAVEGAILAIARLSLQLHSGLTLLAGLVIFAVFALIARRLWKKSLA